MERLSAEVGMRVCARGSLLVTAAQSRKIGRGWRLLFGMAVAPGMIYGAVMRHYCNGNLAAAAAA